ncbi:MAG: hypothetical protein ACREQA_20785 [Candidatus Binatia bacterium]
MSKIRITYLEANNVYRNAWGTINKVFPTLVVSNKNLMKHALSESPIWQDFPTLKLRSYQELESTDTPMPPQTLGRLRMICEENSLYPLTVQSIDPERRAFERIALEETGYQQATNRAAKENERNGVISAMSFAVIGVVVVMTLLIAIIVISGMKKGDDKLSDPVQATQTEK